MERVEDMRSMESAQEHTSADVDTQHAVTGADHSATGDMFLCTHNNHWVPRSEAAKTGKNPSICRTCAADKREQRRQQEEQERQAKIAMLDEIPAPDGRGPTKRVTCSLHQYVVTALDVLAVGSSASEIVERAVIDYLGREDPQVVAFVNRMFVQAISK